MLFYTVWHGLRPLSSVAIVAWLLASLSLSDYSSAIYDYYNKTI